MTSVPEPSPTGRSGSAGRDSGRARDRWRSNLLVVGAVLAPLVVLTFRIHHLIDFDLALVRGEGELEADTLQATRLLQFLGPPSKFGFHHPGPFLAYLLAVPYALSGRSSASLIAGCASLTLLSISGMALWLGRCGKSRLGLVVLLSLCIFALVRFPPTLTSPWPPRPTLFVFGFYLFAAAAFAAGHLGGLVAMVVSGSFLVQTNVLYAAPVLATVTASMGLYCRGPRAPAASVRAWLLGAGLLLLALWTPTLIGELRSPHGNAIRIATALSKPADPSGLRWALWRVARSATRWKQQNPSRDVPVWTDTAGALMLSAALAWSIGRLWRRDRFFAALGATAGISLISGVFVLRRVPPSDLETHHGAWLCMATIAASVTIAAAVESLRHRTLGTTPGVPNSAAGRAYAVASGVALTLYVSVAHLDFWRSELENPEVARMAQQVIVTRGDGSVIEFAPGYFSFAEAVLLELDKRGVGGALRPRQPFWTSGRWQHPTPGSTVFWIGPRSRPGDTLLGCAASGSNPFLPYPVCISVARPDEAGF